MSDNNAVVFPSPKRVYLAHPYGGDVRNKKKVEILIDRFKTDGIWFVSPIHTFEAEYQTLPYLEGIQLCFKLLDECDAVAFPKDTFMDSKGCSMEYGYAIAHNKEILFYEDVPDSVVEEVTTTEDDVVNHPSHYTAHNIEVIDFIEDWELDFRLANCVKYICRAPFKGNSTQDIKKAMWYLQRYFDKECSE